MNVSIRELYDVVKSEDVRHFVPSKFIEGFRILSEMEADPSREISREEKQVLVLLKNNYLDIFADRFSQFFGQEIPLQEIKQSLHRKGITAFDTNLPIVTEADLSLAREFLGNFNGEQVTNAKTLIEELSEALLRKISPVVLQSKASQIEELQNTLEMAAKVAKYLVDLAMSSIEDNGPAIAVKSCRLVQSFFATQELVIECQRTTSNDKAITA
jgi:hypothetical protein